MRRFLLSNTYNTRDLGGYPIDYKSSTMYKAFLRSDVPLKVSEKDIEILLNNKITTIVDLRSDDEINSRPCAFQMHEAFEYYHCKLYGDGGLPSSCEYVPISYFSTIDEQKTVYNIMKTFVKAEGGVLFHCTAGKDRTGVIAALLLLLAGVSREDILADYMISQVYLSDMLQQFCNTNKNVDINIITPKAEYMEKFLNMFLEKYSSVEEYLMQIGLNEEEILSLRAKLVKQIN